MRATHLGEWCGTERVTGEEVCQGHEGTRLGRLWRMLIGNRAGEHGWTVLGLVWRFIQSFVLWRFG